VGFGVSGPNGRGIPRAVSWWLLAATSSFLLGFLVLHFFPSASSPTWGTGIAMNVGMAVAIGTFLGWTRQCTQVLAAASSGAIVIVLGLNLLFLAPTPTEATHLGLIGTVLFDSVSLVVALVGMMVLVGLGAVLGAIIQRASKCRCLSEFAARIRKSGRQWRMSGFSLTTGILLL
jgi:hypothetical protein